MISSCAFSEAMDKLSTGEWYESHSYNVQVHAYHCTGFVYGLHLREIVKGMILKMLLLSTEMDHCHLL